MEPEKLRNWLAGELRTKKLPDEVWEQLIEDGMIREDLDEHELQDLVHDGERLLKMWRDGASSGPGSQRPGRQSREEREVRDVSAWLDDTERERRDVFQEHVARMAAEHPGVQAFRQEILGERFPLPYEEALEEFVDQDGTVLGRGPHAAQLAELTKELERVYFWKEINASWFVLTGYVPPVNTFNLRTSSTRRRYGPYVKTITLTVEPWLSAEKVRKIYSDMQRQILGKDNSRVEKRSLRLLRLVKEQREAGKSWRECMKLYNESYPDDARRDVRNFSTRYREIYEQVLEPNYNHARAGWSLSRTERQERIERTIRGEEAEIAPAQESAERNRREGGSFMDAPCKRDST